MADMNDEPQVRLELSIGRVACPRHSEPFREEWPKGWTTFALTLLQAGLATETLMDEAEQNAAMIDGALERLPLCERVAPAVLMQAYIDCGLGRESRCKNCGNVAQGVVMRLLEPGNVEPSYVDHVCFECIAIRLRPPPTG